MKLLLVVCLILGAVISEIQAKKAASDNKEAASDKEKEKSDTNLSPDSSVETLEENNSSNEEPSSDSTETAETTTAGYDKSDNNVYDSDYGNRWAANYMEVFPLYGSGYSRYSYSYKKIANTFQSFVHSIYKMVLSFLGRYGHPFVKKVAVPYFKENIMPIVNEFGMPSVMEFIKPILAGDGKKGGGFMDIIAKIMPNFG